MKRSHIEMGFLLLYDWLPALRKLPLADAARLMFAMIDRQRDGTPFPKFENDLTNTFAAMIEPSIKRRLDGSASGKRGAVKTNSATAPATPPATPPVTGAVPLKQSKAEQSKAEQSKTQQRGEKAREAAPFAVAEATSVTALPEVGKATPTPTPLELSEEDLSFLEKQGVPPLYVKARLERALKQASACGRPPVGVLLSWWYQDLVEGKGEAYLAQHSHSFDADDFISAALANTYGTHGG